MERSGLAARSAVISRGGEHSIAVVEHEQNLFGSEDPGEGFEKRMASGPAHAERGWRCLGIRGPLEFSLVGVVAGISGALAGAGLSLFVVSTFDTDYILVRAAKLNEAISALASAGYSVHSDAVTHFSHDAP